MIICKLCNSDKTKIYKKCYSWYNYLGGKICHRCYSILKRRNIYNIEKCYECGSENTSTTKLGTKIWHKHPKIDGEYICRKCANLGQRNPFFGKSHDEEYRKRRSEYNRLYLRGERNGNWKGGIMKLNTSIRKLPEYNKWVRLCMERDNFKCKTCGVRGVKLEVNHIIEFAKILEIYSIESVEDALKCEKLWDISNGETLCKSCHKKHHYK